MSTSKMSPSEAMEIWRILVEEVGVVDGQHEAEYFTYCQLSRRCAEYRLNSDLGFGGKFKIAGDGRWHVDAYLEDETPELGAKIGRANLRLEQLQAKGEAKT